MTRRTTTLDAFDLAQLELLRDAGASGIPEAQLVLPESAQKLVAAGAARWRGSYMGARCYRRLVAC